MSLKVFIFIIFITIFLLEIFLYEQKNKNASSYKYSRSAFNQDILVDRLCFENDGNNNGYFLEIGAHDGYSSSNTYYFEKNYNWRGLLIEGDPNNCKKLEKNSLIKKKSIIICAPIYISDMN